MKKRPVGGLDLAAAVPLLVGLLLTLPEPAPGQQAVGPVSPDSAAEIRATLVRPPARPAFDVVDAIELPLRIAAFPIHLVTRTAGGVAAWAVDLEAPTALQAVLRDLAGLGVRPGIGSIGPRSGIAAELRYTGLDPIFLETAFSIREFQRHSAGVRLSGEPGHLELAYTFQRNASPLFWGVGPDSREADETDFLWDRQLAGGWGSLDLMPLRVSGGVAYEDNRVGRGFDNGTQNLQDRFDTATLFGAEERTEYLRFDLGAALDLSYVHELQRRGLHLEAASALYLGLDGTESDFHRIAASAHGYLPLNMRQSLALRALAELNRRDSGRGVPFTHLAELGDNRGGRAYTHGRFRDRDMAALMSEWRYEIWRELHERGRVEAILFLDVGAVERRLTEIDASDLHESYGMGMRVTLGGQLLALGYLAFGEDGGRFQLTFDWAY